MSNSQNLECWTYPLREGKGFFFVLKATPCNHRKCSGCTVWRLNEHNKASSVEHAQEQFDAGLKQAKVKYESITEMSVSNCGSLYDNNTTSFEVLKWICVYAKQKFPNLKQVILESRPQYLSYELMLRTSDLCHELNIRFFVCIGLEIWDEHLRNTVYKKHTYNCDILYALTNLSKVPHSGLCAYFMYKPISNMTIPQANLDILCGLSGLQDLQKRFQIPFIMYINPTYAAANTQLAKEFYEGKYQPPLLQNLRSFIETNKQLFMASDDFKVRFGLYDENLAVTKGSFRCSGDLEDYMWLLNYSILNGS